MCNATAVLPFAPRLLTKRQAAAYCGLAKRTFDEWVRAGRLPKPVPNSARWDKVAIDRTLDRQSGLDGSNNTTPAEPEMTDLERFKAERAAKKAAEQQKSGR